MASFGGSTVGDLVTSLGGFGIYLLVLSGGFLKEGARGVREDGKGQIGRDSCGSTQHLMSMFSKI